MKQALFIEFAADIPIAELESIEKDISTKYRHAVKDSYTASVVN